MANKSNVKAEEIILTAVDELRKQGFTLEDIFEIIRKSVVKPISEGEIKVPISIFKNDMLGSLEAIVKYLRENLLLSYKQIASVTNRKESALAVTYRSAKKKLSEKLPDEPSQYFVPVSVLKDPKLSVLESISVYFKENMGLNYRTIGTLLNRDERTIWTVIHRAMKKRKNAG